MVQRVWWRWWWLLLWMVMKGLAVMVLKLLLLHGHWWSHHRLGLRLHLRLEVWTRSWNRGSYLESSMTTHIAVVGSDVTLDLTSWTNTHHIHHLLTSYNKQQQLYHGNTIF